MTDSTDVMCLSCTHIFSIAPREDVHCPKCEHVEPRASYDSVIYRASCAVRFGYQYPARYAQDRRAGITYERYCLVELPSAITWIALAALSGVVGNATFEVIKTVIRRIAEASMKRTGTIDHHTSELLNDEVKLQEFCNAVQNYNERLRQGLPDPDPLVEEERVVARILALTRENPLLPSLTHEMDDLEKQRVVALWRAKYKEFLEKERPLGDEELARIWKHLDSTG